MSTKTSPTSEQVPPTPDSGAGDSVPAQEIVTNAPEDFDLENLQKYFAACLRDDGGLDMDNYILGFDEVYKFLNLLGTVFGWVASDVMAKIEILR